MVVLGLPAPNAPPGVPQIRPAALAATALGAAAFAGSATQAQIVAGLPWLGMPSVPLQWALPAGLLLTWVWARGPVDRAQRRTPGSVAWVAALAALGFLWLMGLVRHDRLLSAWQGLCLLALLLSGPLPRPALSVVALGAAAGLAVVGYGAIWGETRCDEPGGTGCLVEGGPRVAVPRLLARAGVPVFADLRATDLRGADLRRRDLRFADLRGARLEGARLDDSNLRRARLDDVEASGSSWRGVFMNGASARAASLARADMRQVQAYLVDFSGADLRAADLRQASLSHALLSGVRIEGALTEGAYLRFTNPPWPVAR
jgi:hypothetical protein